MVNSSNLASLETDLLPPNDSSPHSVTQNFLRICPALLSLRPIAEKVNCGMRKLLFLLFVIHFPGLVDSLSSQCVCTNCPQEMPDNFTGDFLINVSGAVNNDLGSPSQGVCGVYLSFDHEYVGDLEITLTSPGGQSVTLLGPIGLFGETDGSIWNVLFVPCASPAAPDPNQSPVWSNDGFTTNETYTGSYYPNSGCLEDFNAGPVDGTWTLTVTDEQALDMGNFINYNIIFCDETGIECVSCDPGGGMLPNPGFAGACEGSPELNMDLPPNHPFNEDPDPNEYDYLYVISQNDIIQEYALTPDLSGYPVGIYEVCGLSYYIPDEPNIPAADGSLTVSVLQAQLESTTPPICGELSTNCLTIEIYAIPDPVDVEATICPGETYSIGNEAFSASGMYTVNLVSVNGCDSIVMLDLTVLDPAINDVEATICEGDFFEVGNADFSLEGIYQIILAGQAAYGCDSTINLFLTVLNPQISVATPDTLNCNNTSVLLDASGSTFGQNADFSWVHADGTGISGADDLPVVEVTQSGTYILTITESGPGGMPVCSTTDSVEVVADVHLPTADAGPDLVFDCLTDSLQLDASGSSDSTGGQLVYTWTGPQGFSSTLVNPFVLDSGAYFLTIENPSTGCVDSDTAFVILDNIIEPYSPAAGIIGCLDATASLSVTSNPNDSLTFQWTGPQGYESMASDTITEVPGDYFLYVTALNGCMDTVMVTVVENSDIPDISGSSGTLTCANPVVQLQTESSFSQLAYFWTGPSNFVSALPQPSVDEPGLYELTVTAPNGCTNSLVLEVLSDTLSPQVVVSAETLTCVDTIASASAVSLTQGVEFSWLLDTGIFVGPLADFFEPDTVDLIATAPNGCSTAVDVTILADQSVPQLTIPAPDTLTCITETVFLDASGSNPAGLLMFSWTNPDGFSSGDSAVISTQAPGVYRVTAVNSTNGCLATDSVLVIQDTISPLAEAIVTGILTCVQDSVGLDGSLSLGTGPLTFSWIDPSGIPLSGQDQSLTGVSGTHVLIVSQENGCTDTTQFTVFADTVAPVALAGTSDTLTCSQPEGILTNAGSDEGSGFSNVWADASGLPVGTTPTVTVSTPGVYVLTVLNNQNGCAASDSVLLLASELPPMASVVPPDTLDCANPEIVLDGSGSSGQGVVTWSWVDESGLTLGNSSILPVSESGLYTLIILDENNGCQDTTQVFVLQDTVAPPAEAGQADTLTCLQTDILLGASSAGNTGLIFIWTDESGAPVGTTDTFRTSLSGSYSIQVTNPVNGCVSVDSVRIFTDVELPVPDAGPDATLDCTSPALILTGQTGSAGQHLYQWEDDGGMILSDSATLEVFMPGEYTLTVTLLRNGCTASDQVLISPDSESPIVGIALPDTLNCLRDSVLLDGSASTAGPQITYQWLSNGQPVGQQNTLLVSEPGVYSLSVLNSQNSCESFEQVTVVRDTVNPEIVAGSGDTLNCLQNEAFCYAFLPDSSNYLLVWTTGSGLQIGNEDTILVSTSGLYTLSATDPTNGCTSSVDVQIFSDTVSPNLSIPPPDLLTCGTQSITLNASVPGNGIVFSWTDNQGQILGSTFDLEVQQPGTYTVSALNLENGCETQQTILVEQDTAAPISPALSNQLITCATPSALLDASAAQNAANLEFNWTLDGQIVGAGSQISASEPGVYTLTLTSMTNLCQSVAQVEVTQDTVSPVLNTGPDGLLTCLQTEWELQSVASGANGAFIYAWLDPSGGAFSDTPFAQVSSPGLYTIVVTDTMNGCASSGEIEVLENVETPSAVATVNGSLTCTDTTVSLVGSGSSSGPEVVFEWTNSQQNLLSDQADTEISTPGLYQLVVVRSDNGCADTAEVFVLQDTVHPVPVMSPSLPYLLTCTQPTILADASASLPSGELDYLWADGNGGALSSGSNFLIEAEGTYSLLLTHTGNGCQTTTLISVESDQEIPVVSLSLPDTLTCLQDTILLDAVGSSSGPDYSYTWSGPGWAMTQSIQQINVFAPGSYMLLITDTSNGCEATGSVTVMELKELPTAVASVSGELDCVTTRVKLSGNGSSQGQNFISLWQTATGGLLGNPQSLEVEATEAGLYTLEISNLINGCSATALVTVTEISDRPTGALISTDSPNCYGDRNGRMTIESVLGGTPPMTYFFKNQGPYTQSVFSNLAAGTYELSIEDSRGCVWDTLVEVNSPPLFTVDLGDDQLIELGSEAFILAQPSELADSVFWVLPESFLCPGILNCVDTPLETTLYRIRVLNDKGCIAEDEMRVRVRKPRRVLIPNVFSPNDDGYNDYVSISVGNDVARVRRFGIYNRWGEQIFEKRDFLPSGDPRSDGWDGRFRGQLLTPDVFVGVAEVEFKDGSVEVFEGSVTLVR